ncbi:hypothetical protein Ato02nite_028820 [Paractinoplanes toevensis]|uniref:Uncharacterized protein n=1 Tax=Paractinoplanes toevensis TaxID=571911 RepID=A0A919T803_9ACTN|nr:hypothetical protein Ato02nite_028820 [Actinoplanes toevensis]
MATGAVAALLLTPAAAQAAASAGTVVQVDVASDGTSGNGYAGELDFSDDGRWAAFTSASSNLTAGDTNDTYDVFVRDLNSRRTTMLSRGVGGQPANGFTADVAISGDGRFVAFTSYASNLVADDLNGERDVFFTDRRTGVITKISDGTGFQYQPSISDDGRFVSYLKSDFLNGNGQDAYVLDRRTGVTRQVTVTGPTGAVFEARLSGNGRWLVFSGGGNLTGDGGSASAVYRADLTTGTTTRVSPQTLGGEPVDAATPAVDRSGTKVLYTTTAGLDPADTNQTTDVYLSDLTAGTTVLVSAGRSGAGNGESFRGGLSADGRYAGLYSTATDLVANDGNGEVTDVFRRDLRTKRTTLISRSRSGTAANGYSRGGIPSGDGSRILFSSSATNLVAGAGDGLDHVFVR